jgi:hypothetical protein
MGVKAGTAAATPIYSKLRLKSAFLAGSGPLDSMKAVRLRLWLSWK